MVGEAGNVLPPGIWRTESRDAVKHPPVHRAGICPIADVNRLSVRCGRQDPGPRVTPHESKMATGRETKGVLNAP